MQIMFNKVNVTSDTTCASSLQCSAAPVSRGVAASHRLFAFLHKLQEIRFQVFN